ncbi:hypothetical protein M0651_23695 [Paenibacillus sp. MBLB2552]|uniref:Lipoprotein n=1 Tax=Paenibacillus mellifer TaxID=2937794 RepID=A0A9X1Y2G3_9BACL|nr:hypothetical protein [Paenibacillus mellifer]MCK8490170.1 hypothetical protein [Paenibacillus mellifer]
MSKKLLTSCLLVMLSVVLVLSGCSSKKEPKEALSSAAVKALEMNSYVLENQMKILDFSVEGTPEAESPEVGAVLSMLKNAEINIKQVYQKDPMQTEATLEVKLTGDMTTTITIPLVMTPEKLYVKVPSIPFLPMPESVTGKFLVLDMKELAEQSGEEFNPDLFNPEKSQKLGTELMGALFAEYESGAYFTNIDPKEASLPEGFKAKQVVQFAITNENVKEAVTILVNQALPKMLDILAKEEYRSMLQLTPEELEQAKKELQEGNQDELGKALDEMKNNLQINKFTVDTAIDENNYPAYYNVQADVAVNDPDTQTNIKVALQMTSRFTQINEKPAFEIGIPTDTLTMEQLQEEMGQFGY